VVLQRFPLRHQVADFPHQRLMAIDDRLRSRGILVETRFRHRRFELLHFGFARRDARLEIGDALRSDSWSRCFFFRSASSRLRFFTVLLPGDDLSLLGAFP
jgi:hypothetical protein